MKIRPETELRLRAGFQRRVEAQRQRYAVQPAHAGQLPGAAVPVRWDQVIEVTPVWTEVYRPAAEESRPALAAYRLRTADGQAHEISRSFKDVQDPYLEMGQLFRHLAPNTIGTTRPAFPTIDQIIAAYAGMPAPGA